MPYINLIIGFKTLLDMVVFLKKRGESDNYIQAKCYGTWKHKHSISDIQKVIESAVLRPYNYSVSSMSLWNEY